MKLVTAVFFGFILVCITVLFVYLTQSRLLSSNEPSSQLQVSASFYPLAFLAQEIGRDHIEVTTITPAGVEPHDYEPTVQDMIKIRTADLVVLNGELEPWAHEVENTQENSDQLVVVTGEETLDETADHSHSDPHTWLSPVEMKKIAQKVTQALITRDPKNEQIYKNNEQELLTKLDQLDSLYKVGLSSCSQRTFITAHEAFGYLAEEYSLEQKGITGLSPDSEPSLQELALLADFAKQNQVKYIFFEELLSPKLSTTLAQEIGAQTLVLNPLESLTQKQVESGENYFSIMESNLKNLQTALECQ